MANLNCTPASTATAVSLSPDSLTLLLFSPVLRRSLLYDGHEDYKFRRARDIHRKRWHPWHSMVFALSYFFVESPCVQHPSWNRAVSGDIHDHDHRSSRHHFGHSLQP